MTQVATEAIVIRHVKQGDTSHVVTLLTRRQGKIAVLAKGNRKPGSRFGAGLELFNRSQISYRDRPNRDLVFLDACDLVESFERLRLDVFGFGAASVCAEITDRMVPDGGASEDIYNLLATALDALNQVVPLPDGEEMRAAAFPVAYQLKLMDLLGIAPELTECASCAAHDLGQSASLSARRGGLLCGACRAAEGGRHLGIETVEFLRVSLFAELPRSLSTSEAPSRAIVMEARGALDAILEFHHAKPQTLRSRKFLDDLWK